MRTSLEVLACGARSPVGLRAESTAAALRAGIARTREFPFITELGQPVIVASDPQLPDDATAEARVVPMLHSVIDEVLVKLGGAAGLGPIVVWLAMPHPRPGMSAEHCARLGHEVERWMAGSRHAVEVRVVAQGHAAFMQAIELIEHESARSEPRVHIVAGVDSYIDPDTFVWLEHGRRFAQPQVRGGFIPAEAAACVAVASESYCANLRRSGLARIVGVGTAAEARLPDSESGSFGEALHEAVRGATAGIALPAEAPGLVYADINGERYRAEEWGFFAMRMPSAMRQLQYDAPADRCGDIGAAFAPLACVLAVEAMARGFADPSGALVTAGSDEGRRGALVIKGPSKAV